MSRGIQRKIIIFCALLMAVSLPTPSLATPENTCPDSAQQFWKAFRQAALISDSAALAKMTYFPLEVRGQTDDSPIRQITPVDFNKILPELLATDPGMSAIPTSMKKYIQNIKIIPNKECDKSGSNFRIGSWEFDLKEKQWYLSTAYLEM